VRSVAEGDLRDLINRAPLPHPMFNARLYLGRTFLAKPDAWWPKEGVAAEIRSALQAGQQRPALALRALPAA
jgi:hypothetical protein